jgi:hypothetical protein
MPCTGALGCGSQQRDRKYQATQESQNNLETIGMGYFGLYGTIALDLHEALSGQSAVAADARHSGIVCDYYGCLIGVDAMAVVHVLAARRADSVLVGKDSHVTMWTVGGHGSHKCDPVRSRGRPSLGQAWWRKHQRPCVTSASKATLALGVSSSAGSLVLRTQLPRSRATRQSPYRVINWLRKRPLCRSARLRDSNSPSKARSSTSMQTGPW